jgi:putative tributyrin esterase
MWKIFVALITLQWYSLPLEGMTAANVIVPETSSGPYPVLYLLHGLSEDHSAWVRRTSIERYAEAYQFMIVMPDSGRGYSADAPDGEAYETAMVNDLVPFIDRTFRTEARRAGRAIGGLSMGGYGALKFAFGYPNLFCSATSHSCSRAVTWTHAPTSQESKYVRVFGPNPSGGPNDLFAVTEKIDRRLLPALRIDCGTEDALLEHNRRFHQHLETLAIPHQYAEFPGGHNWTYWDQRIQEALRFHAEAFAATE